MCILSVCYRKTVGLAPYIIHNVQYVHVHEYMMCYRRTAITTAAVQYTINTYNMSLT